MNTYIAAYMYFNSPTYLVKHLMSPTHVVKNTIIGISSTHVVEQLSQMY